MPDYDVNTEAQKVVQETRQEMVMNQLRWAIEACADAISTVSGIERNLAKVGAYFAATTHIKDKKFNPILSISGATGTGKTQTAKMTLKYSFQPGKPVSAKEQTLPVVRDKIIEQLDSGKATFFIDEADRCRQSEALEEFIYSAYEPDTADMSVNRAVAWGGFDPKPFKIFTPFIVNSRTSHHDSANARRAIVIQTHQNKEARFPLTDEVDCRCQSYMQYASEIKLPVANRPPDAEGGIWNKWELIAQLAKALSDEDFMGWLRERIRQESEQLGEERGYEPQEAIFNALVANLDRNTLGGFNSLLVNTVACTAREEAGFDKRSLPNKMVSRELRKLKFKTKISGGKTKVIPTEESLEKAAKDLGIDLELPK